MIRWISNQVIKPPQFNNRIHDHDIDFSHFLETMKSFFNYFMKFMHECSGTGFWYFLEKYGIAVWNI